MSPTTSSTGRAADIKLKLDFGFALLSVGISSKPALFSFESLILLHNFTCIYLPCLESQYLYLLWTMSNKMNTARPVLSFCRAPGLIRLLLISLVHFYPIKNVSISRSFIHHDQGKSMVILTLLRVIISSCCGVRYSTFQLAASMVRELWRTPLHVGQHCGIILRIITEYKYVHTEWIYWLSAQLTPGYMYCLARFSDPHTHCKPTLFITVSAALT